MYDAGSIEAVLTVATAQASADLDKIEAQVKALEDKIHVLKVATAGVPAASAELAKLEAQVQGLEGKAHVIALTAVTGQASTDIAKVAAELSALDKPHVIVISAVFQDADIAKARRAFMLLDNAISYDAMQRLRSSPQGSVLGSLNALFSPHPVTGGPSPQQSAAKGLLGQMFSSQGGGTTAIPGAQGGTGTVLRDVVTGTAPQKPPVAGTGTGEPAAAAAAAGAGSAAADLKAAAAAETAAAGSTGDAATELKDAAADLKSAAAAGAVSGLQKYLTRSGGAAEAPVPVPAGGGGTGAAGAGSGDGTQSATARLLALAAAATTAAEAAQYASAAQKTFTGSETDVGAAAKDAAASLSAAAAATTSGGDAARYAYAQGVAQSLGLKAVADTVRQAAAMQVTYGSAAKDADAAITASLESVGRSSATAASGTGLFNDSITAGLPLWTASAGRFGALTGHLQLFGGALTSVGVPAVLGAVSGIHLLTEAVIETSGTLIPAAIAFTAFGIAAVPTVKDLYSRMQSLYTVTQAYGVQLYPLTGGFAKVAAAVQPQVYTLFGEALVLAGHSTGAFTQLATGAGGVLDQLGARFVYAVTQGSTFSTFAQKATQDLSIWGNNLGNLGGIIGGVLKVLPGYAQVIGNVFGTVSHDVEDLVNSGIGQAFLKVGLLAHGGLIYVGLLGTAFAKLATGAFPLIGNLAATVATKVEGLGAAGAAAAAGLDGVTAGAATLGALPWGWIAIAAAGIGFLVYQLVNAKTAADQFASDVQSKLLSSSLTNLGPTLASTITHYTDALAAAQKQYSALLTEIANPPASADTRASRLTWLDQVAQQATQAQTSVQDYAAALAQAQSDQKTYNANLATAATALGGTTSALAAFTGAGITSTQFMTTSKQALAELIIEAQGYDDALRAVTQSAGRYGAAQNALNYVAGNSANALGQLDSALTKATQSQDQMLSAITGAPVALDTFEQGIGTLAQNLNTVTGSTATVSTTLANLKGSASLAGAALGGTSQASYALNQAFYAQVQNGQKLIDSLQMQDISTSHLTTVTATMAQQMLGFAGTNTAARAVIVDLINNALGPTTVSMQTLNTWVGKNSTSLSGMNAIIAQSTINASQLAGVLQGDLNPMMAASIIAADGGQKAFDSFATAVLGGNTQGQAFTKSGEQVITTLLSSGLNANAAEAKFVGYAESLGLGKANADALWTSLSHQLLDQAGTKAGETRLQFLNLASQLGLSKTAADNLWNSLHKVAADSPYPAFVPVTGSGKGQIVATENILGEKSQQLGSLTFVAAGGLIGGGIPGKDSVLLAAMPGEVVVPVPLVQAGAVDHLRGMLPGFAAGGMVSGLAGSNLLGTAGETFEGSTGATFLKGAANAGAGALMTAFLAAAAKAAAALVPVTGSVPTYGGGGGGLVAVMMKNMAALRGWTGAQWQALYDVEMAEAGFNMTAQNPSSGAYGLAQFINGPSEYAQYGGNSTTASGQITAMLNYIAQRYGNPEAAWSHESSYHWYDNGGALKPGYTLAFNGTGKPEQVIPAGAGGASMTEVRDLLRQLHADNQQLIQVGKQAPAATGQHVGAAIGGAAQSASFRSRFPRSSP
jgi:hypothetical protein